jgi:hypothetical protein
MRLKGSCHCKAVTFTVASAHPFPFNRCYCEICRKTAGAGGFAINLGADFKTLKIKGLENIRIYRARSIDPHSGKVQESPGERSFCGTCGSPLWLWDPRWPQQVHPHASAIDTELPAAPQTTHMMLASKASWVEPDIREGDVQFDSYPHESLADWHKRLGLTA